MLSFVFITSAGFVATLFSAGFRESGAAIFGVIIGGYVAVLTGAGVGSLLSRGIRKDGPPAEPTASPGAGPTASPGATTTTEPTAPPTAEGKE